MSVRLNGQVFFSKYMKQYLSGMNDPKNRRSILRSGALVVRRQAKKLMPKGKSEYQYTYGGKKVTRKRPFFYYRKGIGKMALIFAGNLANSIYVFRTRINSINGKGKFGDVEIGPRVYRKMYQGALIGQKPASSSGYYAAAMAKSVLNFRKKYFERSYTMQSAKVETAMRKTLERIHKKLAK